MLIKPLSGRGSRACIFLAHQKGYKATGQKIKLVKANLAVNIGVGVVYTAVNLIRRFLQLEQRCLAECPSKHLRVATAPVCRPHILQADFCFQLEGEIIGDIQILTNLLFRRFISHFQSHNLAAKSPKLVNAKVPRGLRRLV